MTEWFKHYWWAIWGIGCAIGLIGYRLHQDGEGGTPVRRLRRLINKTDPRTGRDRNEAAGRTLLWLLPALVIIALFTFTVRLLAR